MDRNSVDWQGAFCAVVTPFKKNGDIDEAAFKENVSLLVEEGIDGIVAAGCTGEVWALTEQERLRVFELAREAAGDDVPVIGNASAILTSEAVRYAKGAVERSLAGVMLTPPAYVKPSIDESVAHYERVSAEGGAPILLYNIPSRVATDINATMLERLLDVDAVVAFKESTNQFQSVIETIRIAKDRIRILPGHSVEWGLATLAMGADGYVGSVEPQVLGAQAISMYSLARDGDWDAARKVQFDCIAVDRLVHGGVGTFPASLKAAMNIVGRPGGYTREPLQPLTDDQEQRLRDRLQQQ